MERYPAEVTKMASNIKKNPDLVPKKQGVTGREDDRLVSDHCLEEDYEEEDATTEDEVDEDGSLVLQPSQPEEYVIPEEKKKKKTKGGKLGETEADPEDGGWSQEQQKLLEAALSQFPKGTNERWERIAGKVEGKSKEQCMMRFKFLAEQIKKKKEGGD